VTEGEERKQRSETLLRARGIVINPHLPFVEDSTEALRRASDEVGDRIMALLIVASKGSGLDAASVNRVAQNLAPTLTPKERTFLDNPSPSQQEKGSFSWQVEAAWALLWALGYAEQLSWPTKTIDPAQALAPLAAQDRGAFLAGAVLKPLSEILDATDLIYRLHWATRDAHLKGKQAPAGLNGGVIVERHRALNWLIGYGDCDWDDVTTDT
jgi:hypothetical protein